MKKFSLLTVFTLTLCTVFFTLCEASPEAPLKIEYITFDTLEISQSTMFRVGVRALDTLETSSAIINSSLAYEIDSQPVSRGASLEPGDIHEFTGFVTPADSGTFLVGAVASGVVNDSSFTAVAWCVIHLTDTLKVSYSMYDAMAALGSTGVLSPPPDSFTTETYPWSLDFGSFAIDTSWSDDTTSVKNANGTFTVQGRLLFYEPNTNTIFDDSPNWPAAGVRVLVFDADSPWCGSDDLLGETYTDSDGTFRLSGIDNNDCANGQDVYLRFYTYNPLLGVAYPSTGWAYDWDTRGGPDGLFQDVLDNQTCDFGDNIVGNQHLPAMWAFQYALRGADKIIEDANFNGWTFKVLYWPVQTDGVTAVNNDKLYVGQNDADAQDLINWGIASNLMYDAYGSIPSDCTPGAVWLGDETCETHAWVEGWQTFFPLTINRDGSFDPEPFGSSIEIEYPWQQANQFEDGPSVAGRVAGALLDLWDDTNDGTDENSDYPVSLEDIFVNTMVGSSHDDFEEFWDDLKVNTVTDPYAHRGIRAIANNTIDFTGVPRGDADANGSIGIGDASYIINYIFSSGPLPVPYPGVGDTDCSGGLSIGDAVYINNYIFGGGPIPCTFE